MTANRYKPATLDSRRPILARARPWRFLDGCTDDVTFTVPGNTPGSGLFTKATFTEWITGVLGQTNFTFQEDVLDVFANDEHGILLLFHLFERDGQHREYNTAPPLRSRMA